jgi:hypothetical protein
MQAAAGIDLRPGVEGKDPVTGAERLALVKPLIQIHDWYCHGPAGCSARIRSTDDAGMGLASPRAASSAASSGPVQCASGTPVAAGS